MTFAVYITVKAALAELPVSGAVVTLRSLRTTTDSNGNATIIFDATDLQPSTLTVSAKNFDDASQTVTFPPLAFSTTVVIFLGVSALSANLTVNVRNSATKQPISGARVFVEAQPAILTDGSGQAQTPVSVGSTRVTVTADGYLDAAPQSALNGGTLLFELRADEAVQRSILVLVSPSDGTPAPTSSAQVQVQDGFLSENYQVGPEGSFVTAPTHRTGSLLNLTITHPNFQTLNTVVTLTDQFSYVVGPLVALSPNSDTGQADTSSSAPGSVVVQKPLQDGLDNALPPDQVKPVDSYEYVYPSGDYGKYFTTTQARMYIGNLFVDELNTVQFALQANRIPIYGYASRDFDAVATGRALVQGQIFINFISEGYLYTIINEYARKQRQLRDAANPDSQPQQQFDNLRRQHMVLTSGQFQYPGNTPSQGSDPDGSPQKAGGTQDTRLQLVEQKMGQLAALGPAVIDSGRFFQPGPSLYANAAYLPFAFDIEIELEGAGRVVKRRLEKCYIGANEQILDQSGNPLGETYSFIARRLR